MTTLSSKHCLTTASAATFLFTFIAVLISAVLAGDLHVINFRSRSLFPEGLAWDPTTQRFLVGSLRQRTISAVSEGGKVETLVSDDSLPENVTVGGITVDSLNHRVVAVFHSLEPLPPFDALAAYDLRSGSRVYLSLLPRAAGDDRRLIANDVTADGGGEAYVTNAGGNYIWKVDRNGEASIFSRSARFTEHTVVRDAVYSVCGLNGIVHVSKGYLLVVQSNTGKMFKVDAKNGTASQVVLSEDMMGADGVALRSDGVVLVVSYNKLWFVKSNDEWARGLVFDKIDLDSVGLPTSVVVGQGSRTYVLHGHLLEGLLGKSLRESFKIAEVRSPKENQGKNVWIFLLLGIGLLYFFFWRFQMNRLVKNMDKKIN
ncbi:uncharacterized protein LOC109811346 [Cajanus cajan]|uniref:SMP-30/Gluconolactonase/LRE-like region domain-containing protein n=1 Tax=Cajanus cajan TaxID=3821 RepID=A0A151UBW8_CAJCA|nr:uncharacterized protein LOC109811346 [Cajanus cajan]KYP76774.1 hypothetical protein KK1_021028 [Cajanus cajan]